MEHMKTTQQRISVLGRPVRVMALAVSAWLGLWSTSDAQEVQVTGPLAGAPAVRHMRVYREGSFQLQPFIGFTLQDQYSRTILLGGQLSYHVTDWLGIGVWGGYGIVHSDTDLTDQIASGGQTTANNRLSFPTAENFPEQIGQMNWVTALQATFIPLRGKLSLFEKIFVDTDMYVFGGVAGVGIEERSDVSGTPCATDPRSLCIDQDAAEASQLARTSRIALAPTFGVGMTFYANSLIGFSLEWRALPFSWNASGTDSGGLSFNGSDFPDGRIDSQDRTFEFNHMVNIGVTFRLPPSKKVTK